MDYQEMGFLAIARGDYQEAINIFRRALEKARNARCFIGLGTALYNLADFRAARWAFYKALELQPANQEASRFISDIDTFQKPTPTPNPQSHFRIGENYLEIYDGAWRPFFIKGINLGIALPGYFPGDFPIRKKTYLKWFGQMSQLGINAVRVYTVHPPCFYEALREFNTSGGRLYLIQGIWAELPANNIFAESDYVADLKNNIRNAVNAVYGNADLPERPGFPNGSYEYDTSAFTVAFLFGREWESCSVRQFNEQMGRRLTDYEGDFVSAAGATPFEAWIAETCNFLQSYEYEKYRTSHPLSVVNWPTLDPLSHPSESDHEKELQFQGIKLRTNECNENEDMESLDVTKFHSRKGGGFFATYHAYPYYPDFMNYDYLRAENTYLAYLGALKAYHGGRPVLIAEFGVPSSREVSHWHRDGWHHGGHNEVAQGEIDGLLMKTIDEAGMAGGVLFSWFDEWYKRNWLFLPYEIPAERNAFWLNAQDAEQNYGLLGMYPGYPDKKVSLSGRMDDWKNAVRIYEKMGDSMAFKFNDGFDDSRLLKSLSAQHDEGFLYLLIETKGKVNFEKANYLVGLDTGFPEAGEFLFPYKTNLKSPVGLKFLIHLAGEATSRILVCEQYDRYLNKERQEITPGDSDQGTWVTMQNRTNSRRISKDGARFFPSRVFCMSALRFGSPDRENQYYDSLADFFLNDNMIEIRLPWGLINFTDPSSRSILWQDNEGALRKTKGIKIIVVSYKPQEDKLHALSTGIESNVTDHLPRMLATPEHVRTYTWEDWDTPVYHSYFKASYFKYKEVLSGIEEFR